MKRGLLPVLLAVSVGVAACGGSSKTTPTTSAAEHAAEQAGTKLQACEGMKEAALAWIKQIIRYSEVQGSGESAALTEADEDSYKAEAAAKKVASAVPATGEGVTRYLTTIGTVRTAISEGAVQHAVGALSEASAAAKAVFATCESSLKE